MGDESSMSGLSGTTDTHGGQGDHGSDSRKLAIILMLAGLCFVFVMAIVVAFFYKTESREPDEEGTGSDPIGTHPSHSGGPPAPSASATTGGATARATATTPSASPASPAGATTGGATTQATTTTPSASPAYPPLPLRPLLCLIATLTDYMNLTKMPPDGLCDVLLLTVEIGTTGVVPATQNSFVSALFADTANISQLTHFGIAVSTNNPGQTLSLIATPDVTKSLKDHWDMKIRHYAFLDYDVSEDPSNNPKVDMILGLKRHGSDFRKNDPNPPPCYVIWGFGMEKGPNLPNFDAMTKAIQPDVLVYMTSWLRSYVRTAGALGQITAPNLWEGSFTGNVYQPTFKRFLEFRNTAKSSLSGIREALAFGLHAYENLPVGSLQFSNANKLGSPSGTNDLDVRGKACVAGPGGQTRKDDTYQTIYTHNVQKNRYFTYDDKDTYKTKMCWAAVNYTFHGGWTLLCVEASDTENKCGDPKYGGDFAMIHYIKEYLSLTFTIC